MHTYHLQDAQIILHETHDIRKVYIELSSECNFTCKMCFRHSFASDTGTMSDTLLQRVQEQVAALPDLQEVVLGGLGEPLLHPRLKECIRFFKHHGIAVTITSNGALMYPYVDFFIGEEVDRIVLSVETGDIGHANESEVFRLLKTIAETKQQSHATRPSMVVLMVLTRENIRDLAVMADKLKQNGVKEVMLSNLLPATPEHREIALYPFPEPKEVKALKSQLLLNVLLDRMLCSAPEFGIQTERSCDFIESKSLVIRWDGEVAPCYRFLHTRDEIVLEKTKTVHASSFGNIQQKNLLDIWNDRTYAWFRYTVHNSRYPSCIDCTFRAGCDFIESTESDCWGNENSCADCLWSRGIVKCP